MSNNIVNVRRILNPFEPHVATSDSWMYIPGQPVGDYLEHSVVANYVISVNGRLLTEEEHKTFAPLEGDYVVLSAIPYGGDGAKGILRIVAIIAISFYAPGLAGTLLGNGASAALTNGVAAAITVAGSAVVNALLPPVQPTTESSSEAASPTYGIDGAKNTATEGVPVPICYGVHRMGGNSISMYTENDGEDQYLYMLLNAGEGPVAGFRDVLINDRPVTDFGEDVTIKYAYGTKDQAPIDWFSRVITPVNFGTTLTEDEVSNFTLTEEMGEARLDFVFPSGLYDVSTTSGNYKEWTVGVEIDYRIVGTDEWTRMIPLTGKDLPVNVLPVVGGQYIAIPVSDPSEYTEFDLGAEDEDGVTYGYGYVIESLEVEYLDEFRTYPPEEEVMKQVYAEFGDYIGRSEVTWPRRVQKPGEGKDADSIVVSFPVQMNVVSYIDDVVEITSDSPSAVRRSFYTGKIPVGVYEFQMKRLSNYVGQGEPELGPATMILSDINMIVHEGVRYRNTALVALKIRMTDNLSSIPNVTYINEGKRVRQLARVGTQIQEISGQSSNPAWILLDLATNTRFGGAMPTDRLIVSDLIKWAAECDLKGYTWNGIIDQSDNFWDVGQLILRVGHAQMVGVGTRHSIVLDKLATPVMMFGMGNIEKGSFQQSWSSKSERANEVDITFADKDDLYKSKTIKVVDTKTLVTGSKRQVASISLQGVDNIDRAYKEGILILNMNREIHETVSFSAPLESIACTIGSVIIVHHDMPRWADSGRLGAGSTRSTIKVDRPLTVSEGHHKILVLQDWGLLQSGTIADIGGNFVLLSAPIGDLEPSVLRVNDKDYQIDSWDDEGVYLETLIGLTIGDQYELIKTDIIEEATIVSYDEENNTVELQEELSVEPQTYANFMVGKVEAVNKKYRIKTLSADTINTRKITAIEYKEEVYDESGYDGSGTITIADNAGVSLNIGHVENLVAYESAYIENRQLTTKASVTWTQPEDGFYKGARIYAAVGESEKFEFRTEATFTTSADIAISIGETLRIKVVAIDMFDKAASQETAPIAEVTAYGQLSEIDVGEVSGAELLWSGRDCKIIWRYNSISSSYEFGSEVGEADAGALDPQFLAYEITTKNVDGTIRRVDKTTDPSYVYTYEKNFEDGISRQLIFEVRMIDVVNNAGEPAILTAYNAPPQLPNLTIVPSFETALFNIVKPTDPDYDGVKIWMARTAEILDDVTSAGREDLIQYRGGDGAITIGDLLFAADYYIKIAAFDVFGETDLEISDVIHFKTTHLDTDAIAEGVLDETVLTDLLSARIDLIDADDSIADSVNARLKAAAEVAKEGLNEVSETVAAIAEDNIAAIISEASARADADSSLATSIDTIAAKTEDNLAAINSEARARTNADSSLATSLSSVSTRASNNTSSINSLNSSFSSLQTAYATQISEINSTLGSYSSTIQQVASSVDGVANSYTVKIDNNGYISGYGLASTNNNGSIVSEFRINADSFSIGLPGYPTVHPFTVGVVNGRPSTIINNAYIQDAAINTLKIAGNAVTHALSQQTFANYSLPPGVPVKTGVLQGSFNASESPQAVVVLVGTVTGNTGSPTNLVCSLRKNGSEIGRQSVTHIGSSTSTNFFMFSDPNPTSGTSTYQVLLGNDYHEGGTPVTVRVTGLITATLR